MKNIIKISLIIFIIGCSGEEKNKSISNIDTIQQNNLDTEQLINEDFSVNERSISYGNNSYIIRTTPYIDSITKKYTVEILLWDTKDTVYVKTINADSLINKMPSDSISIQELKKYKLAEIVSTPGIRDYYSYLIARFSKNSSKDIFIRFQIKAFFGKTGRLWVQPFHYENLEYSIAKEQLKNSHTQSKQNQIK